MNYILNSLEDIEKVFVPNIEYLNDSFYNFIGGFPKSEEAIKNSMQFFEYNYYGEEYERFAISYKQFNHKKSNHKYLGVDYQKLQTNINLEVFLEELEKKIIQEREIFYNDLKEFEETKPNFIINLSKHLDSLYNSISLIENNENTEIEFEKTILDTYLKSYKTYIQVLKREYESIYPTAFKKEQMIWDWSGYNQPIKHTNVTIGKNIPTNPIESILRDKLLSKNTTPESITKIEIINPFPDIFKSIDTYYYFIEYNDKHIVEPFIDYSYLYQRLLKDSLIHYVKHFKFMDWLLENNFISSKKHYEFKVERNFRTLAKCHSIQRENNFNTIFKL